MKCALSYMLAALTAYCMCSKHFLLMPTALLYNYGLSKTSHGVLRSYTTQIRDSSPSSAQPVKLNADTSPCQKLMNCHGKKEQLTSVPILCRITLQNAPYMDHKLLVLMSFEVTTVTSMDSQEPTCCDDGHLLAS